MTLKMIIPSTVDNTALVSSTIAEPDAGEPALYNAGTTYALGNTVHVVGTVHRIYVSNQAANTGNDPVTDTTETWWTPQLSVNRWKPFDGYIGDPATQADSAQWVLTFTEIVDSVAIFGAIGDTVTVLMKDSSANTVYDQTFALDDGSGVIDWATYWFSPPVPKGEIILTDLPPYGSATITITVTATGGTVSVGQIVVGRQETLGDAINGLPYTIEDYSRKDRDAFGRYSITERDYSNEMIVDFMVESQRVRYLIKRLAERRSTATVYAVDTQFLANEFAVYGFFTSLDPIAKFGAYSEVRIELESLT